MLNHLPVRLTVVHLDAQHLRVGMWSVIGAVARVLRPLMLLWPLMLQPLPPSSANGDHGCGQVGSVQEAFCIC